MTKDRLPANTCDPENVLLPPEGSIGFPDRSPELDVLPGFVTPPSGYGEIPFHWWVGDPLTRERLSWQLEQLDKCKGVTGVQINYAHGYHDGGLLWGLTIPSDPPLFSEAWWELVAWFMGEVKRRGMSISLSDYTLGVGQGWSIDEMLREHPDLNGAVLRHETRELEAEEVQWVLPAETLMVAAYPLADGEVVPGGGIDLRENVSNGVLHWQARGTRHRLVAVFRQPVVPSLDPMHPRSGSLYAEKFFGQFERHFPGEGGKGLNFFFSDELNFGVEGNLWTSRFAAEFRQRKGYDLIPELPALFMDVGPRTPKVRLDYRDVMVAMEEECYFRPVFEWHQRRGMIYGCDHGGRGINVIEFGDYFRTQRWNQGPGCDQPCLLSDLIKNKVASSIAHLYLRPRVWLEGFHSSGWGTSTEGLTRATFANFAQGQNLLSLHGLYYTTHGGFWEWAPPCNHFRMPYWEHMREFMAMVQRLSYLLSQGHHCCDVAVLYPVAPMEAGLGGPESVDTAFHTGRTLYGQGVDFDFMDFESLARAEIKDGRLCVSGERYRVLVLPAMRAVRWSTLQKAVEFQNRGGLVVVLGAPPEASDRVGRSDAELDALVDQLTTRVEDPAQIVALMDKTFPRDVAILAATEAPMNFMHRKIGARDVYMIHGAPKDAQCVFRAVGKVELWDPWSGQTRPLSVLQQNGHSTRLRLPLTEHDAQIVVFSPGTPHVDTAANVTTSRATIPLEGEWEFELKPTMDNRFGDFRWPPSPTFIGAEARRFRHAQETAVSPGWERPAYDDSAWPTVTYSFGPKFWKLGPLPVDADMDEQLAGLDSIDPSVPVECDGATYRWQPYEFSWQWGVEGSPGPQGFHGLKGRVSDDFIALGARKQIPATVDYEYVPEQEGSGYYLWTSLVAGQGGQAELKTGGNLPAKAYLNGQPLAGIAGSVTLKAGVNPLLLRYIKSGRGHVVFELPPTDETSAAPGALAMRWTGRPGVVPFDPRPCDACPVGWYRFWAPPGLRSMTVTARGKVQAWVDGKIVAGVDRNGHLVFALPQPVAAMAKVALRIEQDRGCYGGAALPEPIALDCCTGRMPAGDWSNAGVLECYSGGAWYRRTVSLTPQQAQSQVTLDMGNVVATAEVHVNGQVAGVRIAPPWSVDISRHVRPGENRIEVLVYNTLANHYVTIPTRYRGSSISGLLGPVSLVLEPAKTSGVRVKQD